MGAATVADGQHARAHGDDPDEGDKIYTREDPDLLIGETHLAPFSGLELLVEVRQRHPHAVVILTS